MAIDWESGEINEEPHRLRPDQLHQTVGSMCVSDTAYVDTEALSADMSGTLYVKADAKTISEFEIEDDEDIVRYLDLCRVIRLDEGTVIDASTGDFKLCEEGSDTVPVDGAFEHNSDLWIPVIGVIEDEEQRTSFGMTFYERYGEFLSASVLDTVGVEDSDDDEQ